MGGVVGDAVSVVGGVGGDVIFAGVVRFLVFCFVPFTSEV